MLDRYDATKSNVVEVRSGDRIVEIAFIDTVSFFRDDTRNAITKSPNPTGDKFGFA